MNTPILLSKDHIKLVVELEKECFSSPWSEEQFEMAINSSNYQLYGYIEGKKLLAYLLLSCVVDYCEIINIASSPSERQKGYAFHLLNYFIKNNNCQIILEVRSKNIAAKNLYAKIGFKEINVRKNYYADDDAIVMEYKNKI